MLISPNKSVPSKILLNVTFSQNMKISTLGKKNGDLPVPDLISDNNNFNINYDTEAIIFYFYFKHRSRRFP